VGVQIPVQRGNFEGGKRYLHDTWLAERAKSILLQRIPNFGKLPKCISVTGNYFEN